MGESRRPETVAVADEEPHPEITLREISAWSLAVLAAVAIGFVLYAGREIMLPVVAAFVVGVMMSPAARRLEALHVPASSGRIVAGRRVDPGARARDFLAVSSRV